MKPSSDINEIHDCQIMGQYNTDPEILFLGDDLIQKGNSTPPIEVQETKIKIEELIFAGLALIGTITSAINIIIFLKLRLKDNVYKYYLISSIVDFFYMFIISFYALIACGTPCDLMNGASFIKMAYIIVLDDYLTSCLAIYNILIELFITIQRYFLIAKRRTWQNVGV
ncbi:hypothetical protein BpHYR1_040405 [Brachionus plicatilis]|uniref:G-protein coupled receptors family 1 profile domain-containing protein n=1 Tax=Brachionus plicatilis TaxID=10195 RepID=A0A3M7QPH5_BRAPC|nr:hypothetical protein BpHYR1_040405 [Brachionus plicatilis]